MFTEAPPRRKRTITGRILGSGLVDLLTGPHGVDRYTEIVNPVWTLDDARAEVVDVERQTPRSVTLTLRPNRAFPGFQAGQHVNLRVEIDGRSHQRCYSPASAQHDDLIELTIGRHDGGLVSSYLHDRARPGMVVGLDGVARRLRPARRAARPHRAHQRRQRHHARAVDAAHPVRRGPRRATSRSCTTPAPRPTRSTANDEARAPASTRARATRTSARTPSTPTPPSSSAARPPSSTRCARSHPRRAVRELRPARLRHPGQAVRRPRRLRRAAASKPSTTAARCSSRPRPPASPPSSAAGWASATPAPAARPRRRAQPAHRRRSPPPRTRTSSICVSVPVGDVELAI